MSEKRRPVISFASTKGGVGKTTLAYVLATALSHRISGIPVIQDSDSPEYQVACIDADPNRVLDTALRKTGDPGILSTISDGETLLPTLRDAQRRAALVLIDLEGSANQ